MKLLLVILILFLPASASAKEVGGEPTTEIRVNQESNVIDIIVDGETVAQFTSAGLFVKGNIKYTGTHTDIGSADSNNGQYQEEK